MSEADASSLLASQQTHHEGKVLWLYRARASSRGRVTRRLSGRKRHVMNGESRPVVAAPIAHSRESTLLKTRTTQNVPWKSKSFVCINIWGFSLLRGSLIILCLFLFKLLLLYYYRTKKKKKKKRSRRQTEVVGIRAAKESQIESLFIFLSFI